MSTTTKPKKPLFRIEVDSAAYLSGRKWTWRIVSANGLAIVSSTAQLYSRRRDAIDVARKLLRAAKAGRVAISITGVDQAATT